MSKEDCRARDEPLNGSSFSTSSFLSFPLSELKMLSSWLAPAFALSRLHRVRLHTVNRPSRQANLPFPSASFIAQQPRRSYAAKSEADTLIEGIEEMFVHFLIAGAASTDVTKLHDRSRRSMSESALIE